MKITLDEFWKCIKTKSERSLVVKDLWIARSAIAIQVKNNLQPVFGFGAAFNREKAESSSTYELLERIIFLPYLYDENSNCKFTYVLEDTEISRNKDTIQQFLIGSLGPRGPFNANGCAISTNLNDALQHSKRELIERHLCCEIWYNNTRPLLEEKDIQMDVSIPSGKLQFYTTDTDIEGKFIIAALEVNDDFFAIGSAIRSNSKEAIEHATSEALMIFEDAKRDRSGFCATEQSKQRILSLRDKNQSQSRKEYFYNLTLKQSFEHPYIIPTCETIFFEPFPGIHAVRTFSNNAFDPREFEAYSNMPILPLV
jgi:hypothetical protein